MRPTRPLRIGLISDTHGLLRPKALAAMQGCDAIVHAGDVGKPEILDALRAIAPLHAIRGNIDTAPWAQPLPEIMDIEIAGVRLHVLHDPKTLAREPASVDVVVSGHSHKPLLRTRGGVLYVNPGSAGPRRFSLPISVGYLHLDAEGVRGELFDLV
ncbi:metallophosphatase family protein [Xanthomonas sp. AM6]|uniref:metallophosphoesterase family protein n=1 Tax=Xanthomonas sp. AM6 TaxID=2982531 RepID=UPI0021DB6967|nr:metallophosphoesterase family protein [Xanthomonas sp. AM6]UYB52738.1 metallophosphatase family protein [Xanthomonas sp. AM6]